MKTSLEHKTVRPGSLSNYSFYYSNRATGGSSKTAVAATTWRPRIIILLVIVLAAGIFMLTRHQDNSLPAAATTPATPAAASQAAPKKATPAAAAPPLTNCSANKLPHFVKISVGQRHMWACEGSKQVYDSPVITGMEFLAADLTPRGTYHVYGKYTDLTLRGSDTTGSWSDPVSYWMPFLENQHGIYGFHDATWRDNSEFGKVDPNSKDASHGCVELPLSSAKWLYDWAPIGTTATVVD